MLKIKRVRKLDDGSVKVLSLRGPFITETSNETERRNVIELHPTYLTMRSQGCRDRMSIDYGKLRVILARATADEKRRAKLEKRAKRTSVRRGALSVA